MERIEHRSTPTHMLSHPQGRRRLLTFSILADLNPQDRNDRTFPTVVHSHQNRREAVRY
jgi:hypothetical protein